MTINNKNTMNQEQIKNESAKALDVYKKFKTFLEKDEFELFNLKSKKALQEKVVVSEAKIRSLLQLKTKSEKVLTALVNRRKVLVGENRKLKDTLVKKLKLEVVR
mgnify:CR=1 FL=1